MTKRKELFKLGKKISDAVKKNIDTAPSRKKSKYHAPHIASGNLRSNIFIEIEEHSTDGVQLILGLPAYADELDKGQSGYGVTRDTEYVFDASVNEIRKWILQKGWVPPSKGSWKYRDTAQSYAAVLRKRLKYTGIKPTYFLTDALDEVMDSRFYDTINEIFADDYLELTITEIDKQKIWKK